MANMSVTAKQDAAQQYAAGLRAMADMIEAHPDLAPHLQHTGLERILVAAWGDDPRPVMAAFIRAAKRHGAAISKLTDKYVTAELRLTGFDRDLLSSARHILESLAKEGRT